MEDKRFDRLKRIEHISLSQIGYMIGNERKLQFCVFLSIRTIVLTTDRIAERGIEVGDNYRVWWSR